VARSGGLIRTEDAPVVVWRAGVQSRLHRTSLVSPTGLCVLEQWTDPGAGAPTHRHANAEELIVVIEGSVEFWHEDDLSGAGAGDSILLPTGSRHGFRNSGEGVLHTMAIFDTSHPLVEYDEEPGCVLEIGGTSREMRDAHRACTDGSPESSM
jgi:quercetin dioxygenase-like cupin family protein